MKHILTHDFASRFANEWIEAWNSHDLDRVLAHYTQDVKLTSPFVRRILGSETEIVQGIEELRRYFSRALEMYPDLHFVPRHVYAGVSSLVIEYESVGGRLSAETLEFDTIGKVFRIIAHYSVSADPV